MRKSFVKLTLLLILLLSTTGCWTKVELDDRVFVNGLFVDVGEEPGTVKVSISSPLTNRLQSGQLSGGASGNDKPYSLISKQSTSISKAIEYMQKDLPRKLGFTEIRVIVISERYGKQGISDLLEWVKRDPDVPIGAYLLVASDKLEETVRLTPIFEQMPTAVLINFARQGYMLNTTISDCLFADSAGMGFAVTLLKNSIIPSSSSSDKNENWTGIKGAALFQQSKLKGILPYEEAKAIAWANGTLKSPIYSIQWGHKKNSADLEFSYAKGKTSFKMTEEGPVFTIHLKGRVSILANKNESHRFGKDISEMMMKQLEKKVIEETEKSMAYSQQIGVDVLQLGFLLEWNRPQYWQQVKERWPEHYKNDVKIKTVTNFRFVDIGKEY
ncbi:Ger(x)C family spore germination protein [Paenibacillus sp. NPDC058071]|uniref:Ger(x)C family spore germination protein n=1 Tax=Paenibacillus sp. NPDC058071 TaxID=3346326 RepID=UPI0036D7B458